MKKHIKTTYRVTVNGYDYDFESASKAVYYLETAVSSFVPDRWHDTIHASMELIVEKPEDPEGPEEVEEVEEVEDDETAISG